MADTSIRLKNGTRDRLKGLGRKGETYDELLNRLMDAVVGSARRKERNSEV